MTPLQMFGATTPLELLVVFGILVLAVGVGTYLGVLLALQAFFGEPSWQEVATSETD
jgi:hypothetical protein